MPPIDNREPQEGELTAGPDAVEAFLAAMVRRFGAGATTAMATAVGTVASFLVSWAICTALGFRVWGNVMAMTMPIVVPLIVGPPFTYVYLRAVARLDTLAEERRAALAAAHRANEARLHFFASVSHDLRTPLNAVIGFSEIMQTEAFGPVGHPKYREYVGEIKRSGTHLLDLVNDLLTVAEVTSSDRRVDVTTLHPRPIVRDLLATAMIRARDSGVRLRVSAPRKLPRFLGNRQCVRQVLLNLLGNAFKFTPKGRRVDLTVHVDGQGRTTFEILDQGPGIPLAVAEAIGQPFLHAGSGERQSGAGFGLGLSIAKSLCDAMGAELSLTNEPQGGTRACVSFPPSLQQRLAQPDDSPINLSDTGPEPCLPPAAISGGAFNGKPDRVAAL